jgi:hypothetical protein
MKLRAALLFSAITISALSAQQKTPASPPQTARQALIEMITGGSEGVKRHLTVEMQKTLEASGKDSADEFDVLSQIKSAGADFQVFETGQVLLSAADPKSNEKMEVHVENDDLSGDTDNIDLSFHQFRDGVEQEIPFTGLLSRFTVGLKRQANIWRLNELSINLKVPLGDPKLLEKAGSNMPGMFGGKIGLGTSASSKRGTPRELPMEQAITMVAFAEGIYATQHPETGFTCALSDLGKFNLLNLDERIFKGEAYKGYKFSLSGCQGKPAETFHVVAEPVSLAGGAKAYCTDATRNVRTSDDGSGSTCLMAGKLSRPSETEGVGVHVLSPSEQGKPAKK